MFQWFQDLIGNKKSEIQSIIFYGNVFSSTFITDYLITKKVNKNIGCLLNSHWVSASSMLLAHNPDLAICIHNISYVKKSCLEIVYFDDESKKLADIFIKTYKKIFKDRQIDSLEITKNSMYYTSFQSVKNLKRKIMIKPSEIDTDEDLSLVFETYLGKI